MIFNTAIHDILDESTAVRTNEGWVFVTSSNHNTEGNQPRVSHTHYFSDILLCQGMETALSLQWCHNERDGISNHQPHDCSLNCLFRRRSKKTSKLCVTGLCAGNLPVISEFPPQRTSNTENVSIWWSHHGNRNPHYFSSTKFSFHRSFLISFLTLNIFILMRQWDLEQNSSFCAAFTVLVLFMYMIWTRSLIGPANW